MKRIFGRIVGPFREFGGLAGSLYIAGRIFKSISAHIEIFVYELMVQPIPTKDLLPDRLSKGFEIREIRRGDPGVELMPARAEIKQSRFDQNAVCLGAYKRGSLIGYLWLCFRSYDEDEVRCRFLLHPAEQSVFDFDLYIFPEHRMGLGFMGIWNGVNRYLRERDIKFTFSRLTRFNLPSRRAHAHLGWKKVADAVIIQAWDKELMFFTVAPYVAISWNRRSRVSLHLRPDALTES